jgi:hypothetical protein
MPFGYAVPVFLLALATLIVVVPPRRSRPHARLSFWAGAVLNELPQLVFYLLLGVTVLTIAGGDIRSAAGWLAVGRCLTGRVGSGSPLRARAASAAGRRALPAPGRHRGPAVPVVAVDANPAGTVLPATPRRRAHRKSELRPRRTTTATRRLPPPVASGERADVYPLPRRRLLRRPARLRPVPLAPLRGRHRHDRSIRRQSPAGSALEMRIGRGLLGPSVPLADPPAPRVPMPRPRRAAPPAPGFARVLPAAMPTSTWWPTIA